jgi:hypothetical protein
MSVTPSGHLVGRPDTPQDSTFGGDVTDGSGAVAREIRFQFRVIPVFMARHKMTAFAVNLIGAPPSTGPCARVGNTQPQAPTLNGEVAGWDMQVGKRALIPFVQFGVPPYTFCTLAGALPPGLAFDSASGMIRGTPTRPGGYTVAIAVADAVGVAGPSSITIGFVVAPKPPPKRKHTP